eukprot:7698223-Karenia_brevis.AAC.1
MEDVSISSEDMSELWVAEAKQFLADMDRIPRFILLRVYGKHLTNVCVVLKGHPHTCMCSGCQTFSQAQSIIVREDPNPNEYFDPLTAVEKITIQNGLQS